MLQFWISFMIKFWEEIFEVFIVLIPVFLTSVFGIGLILWQVSNTFKAQRKENARQFLHHAQLESVKEILPSIDNAYGLIIQSSIDILNKKIPIAESREIYFRGTHAALLEMDSIDLYIDFIPELKAQLSVVKKKIHEARKIARIRYDVKDAINIDITKNITKIAGKHVSAQTEIAEFRKNVLLIYGDKIKVLTRMTKI